MINSDVQHSAPVKSPSIWKAALVLAVLLAMVWGSVSAFRARQTPESIAMESLIAFTLERGKPTWVPAPALKYFGLPADSARFLQVKAKSESGRTRAIQVRTRDDDTVDVFFVELLPNETKGYFYLASPQGRLIKAAYLDEAPEAISNSGERFAEEIRFWRHWQAEALEREVI